MAEKYLITCSDALGKIYPSASIGILSVNIPDGVYNSETIRFSVEAITRKLREDYPDLTSLKKDPLIQAYGDYYRKFDKTYHLLAQLESVILKGKSIASPFPLLQIIFAMELKNKLLTAVHDLDTIEFPLRINVASGDEEYVQLNGSAKKLKPKDIFIADKAGVISSIIYGPDHHTKVSPATDHVLVTVYAPNGISHKRITSHFDDILQLVLSSSGGSSDVYRGIFPER